MILTRLDSSQKDVIMEKIQTICDTLQKEEDGQPAVLLYVGMAFGDRENPGGDIFQDADEALNRAREYKDGKCVVY
jgi:hypothetical protein